MELGIKKRELGIGIEASCTGTVGIVVVLLTTWGVWFVVWIMSLLPLLFLVAVSVERDSTKKNACRVVL